jgi:hypothetical protein
MDVWWLWPGLLLLLGLAVLVSAWVERKLATPQASLDCLSGRHEACEASGGCDGCPCHGGEAGAAAPVVVLAVALVGGITLAHALAGAGLFGLALAGLLSLLLWVVFAWADARLAEMKGKK